MSTIHLYLNNVGSSHMILNSPLVNLCEQWREWSRSKTSIIILTHCKISHMQNISKEYLLHPVCNEESKELILFLKNRGKNLLEKSDFENLTLINLSFTVPWVKSKNPPSIGKDNNKSGIIQIVEYDYGDSRYLQFTSPIIDRIWEWKQTSGYCGLVLIWSHYNHLANENEQNPPPIFHRLLWPQQSNQRDDLLKFVRDDPRFENIFSDTPNPGHFADLWGKIDNIMCKLE